MRDLLALLSDSQFHSGEALGSQLGVTRAAIWKQLKKLEAIGVIVHSVKGRGYRLPQPVEMLSLETMQALGLSPEMASILYFETDSTNLALKRLLSRDAALPILVLAERQVQGKGRRGREWQGGVAQNIMLSFGWQFDAGTGAIEGLSLAVGVAVARVLTRLGVSDVGLKWPNDVQVNGKKVAGVLLEMVADNDVCRVIIGIGLNVRMPPDAMQEVTQPWTDLSQVLSTLPSRNQLVVDLTQELVAVCESFDQGRGLKDFSAEWQQQDVLLNQDVKVLSGNKTEFGIARGIDEKGALLLEEATGLRPLYGGEISVRKQ